MASEKQLVLSWLYRAEFPAGVLDFMDILVSAAEEALGKPRIEAEHFASITSNQVRYWNWLLQELDQNKQRGLKPLFVITDINARSLVWFPQDFSLSHTVKDKHCQVQLRARPSVLKKIDSLNDREYEALSCVVCRAIGAQSVHLTPRGNEGGIDFFASIRLTGSDHLLYNRSGPLRVVGQCKKYQERVSVDKIKEFITTLDEIKNQAPTVEKVVPPWFRTNKGPIVGWIIAHNGFQSGAETKAKNHGILLSDSIDLAEAVCLCRTLAPSRTGLQTNEQLYLLVRQLLRSFT